MEFLPPKIMKIKLNSKNAHKLSDLNTNIFQGITTGKILYSMLKLKIV